MLATMWAKHFPVWPVWSNFSLSASQKLLNYCQEFHWGISTLNSILPHEQKGIFQKSHNTKVRLLFDKMGLQNCKRQKTNLMLLRLTTRRHLIHSLIHGSWTVGISRTVIMFIKTAMSKYNTRLIVNGKKLEYQMMTFPKRLTITTSLCQCHSPSFLAEEA